MKVDFLHFGKSPSYQLAVYQERALEKALQKCGATVRHVREESPTIRDDLQRLWSDPPHWTLSIDYAFVRSFVLHELEVPHLHLLLNEPYPLSTREGYGQHSMNLLPAIELEEIVEPQKGEGTALFASYRDGKTVKDNLFRDFSPAVCRMIIEGAEASDNELLGVNIQAIKYLRHYIARAHGTTSMLETFKDNRVALYGSPKFPGYYECQGSWKEFARSYPHFEVHGPLPAHEVIQAMKPYNLVLAPDHGLSLRLIQGLAAGKEVMTYRHPDVVHYFGQGSGVRYFGDETSSQDISQGQEIIKRHFTWDIRAKEILRGLT